MYLKKMICKSYMILFLFGILSTGKCLDNTWSPKLSNPLKINKTVNYSPSFNTKMLRNNTSKTSSSTVIRSSRLEVSSSSILSSPYIITPRSISSTPSSINPSYIRRINDINETRLRSSQSKDKKISSNRNNKPLLNSLVSKLELLTSKMDELTQVQVQMQKSFDNFESKYTVSTNSMVDDRPECGQKVETVLETLTPLVNRVEQVWSTVLNTTIRSGLTSSARGQFLGPPPNDILLSESKRQERAITGVRNDLNIRTSQIMSELGTVEQQLDALKSNLRKSVHEHGLEHTIENIDSLTTDLQNLTEGDPTSFLSSNGSNRLSSLVFPSVRNKPNSEIIASENIVGLLTGIGQSYTSCADLLKEGKKRSGLYHLSLPGARSPFWQLLAFCDQETSGGGWMVIQRRADFSEPRENFNRNWIEYRGGFGDPMKEVWIGNLNLHLLTAYEEQTLRIELEDFDGEKRYAEYSSFKVGSEVDGFRLEVSGYSGDAGDALSDPWYGAHGSLFSTNDRDNDRSSLNCASMLKGGWWWKSCGRGLNGIYFDTPQPDSALARQGIVWFRWKGWDYTLRKATMMIRPKNFRLIEGNTTTYTQS